MDAQKGGYFGKVHTLRNQVRMDSHVVEKVEEYRSRNGPVEMESKRLCRRGREWTRDELLLQVDCQHVDVSGEGDD